MKGIRTRIWRLLTREISFFPARRGPVARVADRAAAAAVCALLISPLAFAGGPAWIEAGPAPSVDPGIARAETAYASRLGGVPPVVLDLPAIARESEKAGLRPREVASRRLAARLNARGRYFNLAWRVHLDRSLDALGSPHAHPLWLFGAPGADGSPGLRRVLLVAPYAPGVSEVEHVEQGFAGVRLPFARRRAPEGWRDFILDHELEHAVDAHAHGDSAAATVGRNLAAFFAGERDSASRPDPGELFADLGAAARALRRPGGRALVGEVAELRTLGPLFAVSRGRAPYLGHFTSPALFDLLADHDAGRETLGALSGDSLTRALDARRREAVRDLNKVDWARLAALATAGKRDLADTPDVFEAAGLPARWTRAMRRAVSRYRAGLDCRDAEGLLLCRHAGDSGDVWIQAPSDLPAPLPRGDVYQEASIATSSRHETASRSQPPPNESQVRPTARP